RRDGDLGPRGSTPEIGARPRVDRLTQAREEARDLEGDEVAGVGFDVGRLVAPVGLDVRADELDAAEEIAGGPGVGHGRVDLVVLGRNDRAGSLVLAQDRRRHVAVARPGRERLRLIPAEVSPALSDRALDGAVVESESDAVEVVDRVELIVEAILVLAEVI